MDFFQKTFGFAEVHNRYNDTQQRLFALCGITKKATSDFGGFYPEHFIFNFKQEDGSDGRVIDAGVFSNPSNEELESILGALLTPEMKARLGGPTCVKNVVGESRSLHARPQYAGAVIQAASQFNYLEFASPSLTPEHGITMYMYDRTQGPACAIACAAGTATRNYLARVVPFDAAREEDVSLRGQRADRQFNGLRGFEEFLCAENPNQFFDVKNGYVESSEDRLRALTDRLKRLSNEETEAMLSRLRIGVQWDTQVTDVPHEVRRVTQTYNSALSVGYSRVSAGLWTELACLVLKGSYRATMLVGAINAVRQLQQGATDVKPVLLTKVGGGVFGNDPEWIQDAIDQSVAYVHQKFGVAVPTYIVHYGQVEDGYDSKYATEA